MSVPREGSRDDERGLYISKYPDVCRSPKVPIPYTIVAIENDDANTEPTVRYTGKRVHHTGSIVTRCTGDEPGTGLGVKSGTVGSVCRPKGHSNSVRVGGEWAVRDGDEVYMNGDNTIGKRVRRGSRAASCPTPPLEWEAQGRPQRATGSKRETNGPEPETMTDFEPSDAQFWRPGTQLARGQAPVRTNPVRGPTTAGGPGGRKRPKGSKRQLHPYNDSVTYPPDFYIHRAPPYEPGTPGLPESLMDVVGTDPNPVFRGSDGRNYPLDEVRRRIKDHADGICRPEPRLPPPPFGRTPNNVSVLGTPRDRKRPCLTGPYKDLECPGGEEAHHIVPDYTLRYGNRAQAKKGQKRIPGLPSFWDGPAICLAGKAKTAGSEHSIGHLADGQIATEGGPDGTIPVSRVTAISIASAIEAARGCAPEIFDAISKQPSLMTGTKARSTIMPPYVWPPGSKYTP